MKRDWKVVQQILEHLESADGFEVFFEMNDPETEHEDYLRKKRHAMLLKEAGHIQAYKEERYYRDPADEGSGYLCLKVNGPTWSGYDLLERLRSTPSQTEDE